MALLEGLDRTSDLMMRMSDTLGVDLGEALLEGRLTGADLRSAAVRCSGCEAADVCGGWMAEQAGTNPEAAPGYCNNADLFARLRD